MDGVCVLDTAIESIDDAMVTEKMLCGFSNMLETGLDSVEYIA